MSESPKQPSYPQYGFGLRMLPGSPLLFPHPSLHMAKGLGPRAKGVGRRRPSGQLFRGLCLSPLSLSCRRCIIVGNGGVLANKSLGSRIDDYDIVVR